MAFEFATATRIRFGPGTVREVAPAVTKMLAEQKHGNLLLVTGLTPARTQPLFADLQSAGIAAVTFPVDGEPTTTTVQQAADLARAEACALVVGFGGGSVLDTAKATAALLANGGNLLDYLEIIGQGKPLQRPSVPWVAIPTTAGTGSEVTRNAVLTSPEHNLKVSLRSPLMLARLAIVDPELTYTLPPDTTAATGLDALTQLTEPYVSIHANPMTDAICREGITRAARSLRRACTSPNDTAAREDMALASLFGGLALANAGLGAVHGFAGVIGGCFPAPHGALCAALLPHAMRVNAEALQNRAADSPSLQRFAEIARIVTGCPTATTEDGITWIAELCADLRIPPLRTYGMTSADIPSLVPKAAAASSMKANPIKLTPDEMTRILTVAI